jgi:hypothetical protein
MKFCQGYINQYKTICNNNKRKKYLNEVNSVVVVVVEFFLSKVRFMMFLHSEYLVVSCTPYYDLVRSYFLPELLLSLLVRWRQNWKGDFSNSPFSPNVANDIVLFKASFFYCKKTHDLMHRRSCIDGKEKKSLLWTQGRPRPTIRWCYPEWTSWCANKH